MLAFDDCQTEQEGWRCYDRHIAIFFSILRERFAENRVHDNISRRSRARIVEKARYELVGALYMIRREMDRHGFQSTVVKMGEIIELVAKSDLTDPNDRERIRDKFDEFCSRVPPTTSLSPTPTNQAA